MFKRFNLSLFTLFALSVTGSLYGQDDYSQHWNGEWVAEGTLFQIEVSIENNVAKVIQIESMGFEWTSQDGIVDGNIVLVEVEYAGITGVIQAELVDANTAIVFAASCLPDFMVVCVLAKGRQAIFKKVATN